MILSKGFIFSQSNLQDYVDCQRRFQLRHMFHQAWPAVEAEPFLENERIMDQGAKFHQIVRQHLIGVPESQISQTINGDELMQLWWRNYIHSLNNGILEIIFQDGNKRFEELTFSTPLEEFRLIAKYDLLIFRPDGKVIIIDWKTSQKHPKRSWLADRLQSHVYPFVLSRAASAIIGGNQVDPDQIEMIYWFTNQPELPERFSYNESSYHADTEYLSHLSSTISQISESVFPLTQDVRRCLYCTYRSLCNRGIKPGDLQRLEEWQTQEPISEITIDYDQIGEIEF